MIEHQVKDGYIYFKHRSEWNSRLYQCRLHVDHYASNNRPALVMECYELEGEYWDRYAELTTNVLDHHMPIEYAALDINNFSRALEVIEGLGIGSLTNIAVRSGFCTYPVVELNLEAFESGN